MSRYSLETFSSGALRPLMLKPQLVAFYGNMKIGDHGLNGAGVVRARVSRFGVQSGDLG